MEAIDVVKDLAGGDPKNLPADIEPCLTKALLYNNVKKQKGIANRFDIIGWLSKRQFIKSNVPSHLPPTQ